MAGIRRTGLGATENKGEWRDREVTAAAMEISSQMQHFWVLARAKE
jgi:hypothetical protein